jgi:hypothetical protein
MLYYCYIDCIDFMFETRPRGTGIDLLRLVSKPRWLETLPTSSVQIPPSYCPAISWLGNRGRMEYKDDCVLLARAGLDVDCVSQSSCLKNPTVCWIDTGWVGLCIHPGLPAVGDVFSCSVLDQTMSLGPCAARGPLSKACYSYWKRGFGGVPN